MSLKSAAKWMQLLVPPWWPHYRLLYVSQDMVAGVVVALMLIPQGLAYATLAGVPPVYGLYASVLPLFCYALLGSSAVLSVGPMAITSLLTASALAPLGFTQPSDYIVAAAVLAFLSGAFLMVAGFLRLGALAQLLSHPVVSSFITGAAMLIILSQLEPLLGVSVTGNTGVTIALGLVSALPQVNPLALMLGGGSLLFLMLGRLFGADLLIRAGLSPRLATLLQRLLPMFLLLLSAWLVHLLDWQTSIAVVGALPLSMPSVGLPPMQLSWFQDLWLPAVVIGLLGFVESISIAQSFAMKSRQPLNPNAELRGLGLANIGSSVVGGFPVSGGFSRTLVNSDAGARSPLSGIFAAGFLLLALWFAAALFAYLPITVLAATIIAAAVQLIDFRSFRDAWRYDRTEAIAMLGTALGVLVAGIEVGIGVGLLLSLMTVVWRTSQPHIAVVGRVPGTEHFRNIERHQVETQPHILMIRIDESLVFANAEAVLNQVMGYLEGRPEVRDVVLVMSSVSRIDVTALEMLQHLNDDLAHQEIRLHLAEVKGPVADQLQSSDFIDQLTGQLYLSAHLAYQDLGH